MEALCKGAANAKICKKWPVIPLLAAAAATICRKLANRAHDR